MPERIIIAALGENRVIGKGDGLPWSIPGEYRHFLDTVRGATMIMGRRSYSIFGPDLSTAHNLVLSRDASWKLEGARDFWARRRDEGDAAVLGEERERSPGVPHPADARKRY